MKIEYEIGDVVEVEDNSGAGWCSAQDVKLIEHIKGKPDRWVVQSMDTGDKGSCGTIYFRLH